MRKSLLISAFFATSVLIVAMGFAWVVEMITLYRPPLRRLPYEIVLFCIDGAPYWRSLPFVECGQGRLALSYDHPVRVAFQELSRKIAYTLMRDWHLRGVYEDSMWFLDKVDHHGHSSRWDCRQITVLYVPQASCVVVDGVSIFCIPHTVVAFRYFKETMFHIDGPYLEVGYRLTDHRKDRTPSASIKPWKVRRLKSVDGKQK